MLRGREPHPWPWLVAEDPEKKSRAGATHRLWLSWQDGTRFAGTRPYWLTLPGDQGGSRRAIPEPLL